MKYFVMAVYDSENSENNWHWVVDRQSKRRIKQFADKVDADSVCQELNDVYEMEQAEEVANVNET